jgi:hypothetical protein
MIKVSKSVTDADLARAAAYYAALPVRRWIRIVETDMVPVTRSGYGGWLDSDHRGSRRHEPHVPDGSSRWPRRLRACRLASRRGGAGRKRRAKRRALHELSWPRPQKRRRRAPARRPLRPVPRPYALGQRPAPAGPVVARMRAPTAGLSEADITDVVAYLASLEP